MYNKTTAAWIGATPTNNSTPNNNGGNLQFNYATAAMNTLISATETHLLNERMNNPDSTTNVTHTNKIDFLLNHPSKPTPIEEGAPHLVPTPPAFMFNPLTRQMVSPPSQLHQNPYLPYPNAHSMSPHPAMPHPQMIYQQHLPPNAALHHQPQMLPPSTLQHTLLTKRSYSDTITPPPMAQHLQSTAPQADQHASLTAISSSTAAQSTTTTAGTSSASSTTAITTAPATANPTSATPRKKRTNKKKLKSELVIERKYLRMKQSDAAFHLGFSPSTFSKRWRSSLPNRKWPFRKHFKLQNSIKDLKALQKRGFDVGKDLDTLLSEKEENLQPAIIHYCEKDVLARQRSTTDYTEDDDESDAD